MEERGIRANVQTYLWLFEGCFNSGSLLDAKKLHARIFKSGFDGEDVLGSRLIDIYLAHGEVDNAIKLFDDIPSSNVSFWNKVISGLLAKKLASQVLGLFSLMITENVTPDESTFASVLRACSGGKAPFQVTEQIHAKIIHHGFGSSPLVCNPLIDLYSKNGHVDLAKLVFERLFLKDSVSWVAMISGLSQNGREDEAILLFCQMHKSAVIPTPYVFSSVLSACTKIELFKLGEQLHGFIVKWGLSSETFVCNALVTLYSRWGNLIAAEQIFSKMHRRDRISYNSLISGLAQRGFSDRALQLFEKMQLDCMKPDCVTVASLLSACASVGAGYKGKQLHSYVIKMGMSSDLIIEGSLLDLYVKCFDIETAHEYFLTTETENVVLWNVMLVAYGQLGNLSESYWIFLQMQIEGLMPNQYTYPSILRTCTSLGALDLGEQIHTQVIKSGFQFNVYVCSVLIDMYAKHGELDTARGILQRLREEDVVSWTAMIAGYTQHDLFAEALKLFQEMENQGIRSDNIGFSSAISACAGIQALNQGQQIHAQSYISGYSEDLSIGNALASNVLITLYSKCGSIEDAKREFFEMPEKNVVSWNAMITGYSQHGYGSEAVSLFEEMKQLGLMPNHVTFVGEMPIEPDAMIWRTLLSACTVHKNIEIGEFAARHLLELEPEDSATYVLLSNMYAVSGKWDYRDRTRQMMKDRGVKKEPGRSWIEVKNSIHAFFVGDRLHPLAEQIYEYIDDLNERAGEIGYVQDRYNLLNDVEQEQKDPTAYIHSEKLAVAFGLLSLTNTMPIRVIKNLRVCNDCHNWIKFVSKISNRAIVVRDAYRFHHFEGGVCSCKDYW
ncbi:unnamed protein product, partial [Vitis vinifera]